MDNRLPVGANRSNLGGRRSHRFEQLQRRTGKFFPDHHVHQRQVSRESLLWCRSQRFAQRSRVSIRFEGNKFDRWRDSRMVQLDQGSVNAIHRSSRGQTNHEIGLDCVTHTPMVAWRAGSFPARSITTVTWNPLPLGFKKSFFLMERGEFSCYRL